LPEGKEISFFLTTLCVVSTKTIIKKRKRFPLVLCPEEDRMEASLSGLLFRLREAKREETFRLFLSCFFEESGVPDRALGGGGRKTTTF